MLENRVFGQAEGEEKPTNSEILLMLRLEVMSIFFALSILICMMALFGVIPYSLFRHRMICTG